MGSTSKSAWTAFERVLASAFSEVIGKQTFRVPLSGIGSRHNAGDVIIPKQSDGSLVYDILFEAKYRNSNAQHTLFYGAVADAKKNGVAPKRVILCTKVKRQQDYLVTLNHEFFWELMNLPGALEILKPGT